MPTLPSTFHTSSLDLPGLPNQINLPDVSSHGGPTPDPDLDDVVVIPVVPGDPLGAVSSTACLDATPAHVNVPDHSKPRLSLTGLSLHSPSSIIGTPFDVSEPRFEYPFPETAPEPDFYQGPAFPAFSGHVSSFFPTLPTAPRQDAVKTFSPTHPKLQPRDPPVPPSLANKKRWSSGIPAPPPQIKSTGRGRSPSVKAGQAGRGTTSRAASEEGRPKFTRKTTARAAGKVRPASPDAK
ncbi:hypothetical protein EIP91_007505 [Steccherinum ochraceum]|uniref:Uncharacterized protein n=1 Tax=Steccherinum ochraceum TaxID=92696 RepID=A0A4R0R9W0_9APHY|nr:hypothetical protein EIP91_007505 [Steccherinum ochraceum]